MATKGGRVTAADKRRLQEAGLWASFQQRRDELKKAGQSPGEARVNALGEFLAQAGDRSPEAPTARKRGKPAKGSAKDLSDLAGRVASEPEVVRWVARNIDNPSPDPKECPDPTAWTLLNMCRGNAAATQWFMRELWSKLLVAEARKSDGLGDEVLDGQKTVELIDRILGIRDRAQKEGA